MEVGRRRIKREPPDPDEAPLPPKQAASPAQEATRARIASFESQLHRLYRMRAQGRLDQKAAFQIRCLEEDLRKAHSKLRRLLNEAERQRRRRERLRNHAPSTSNQPSSDDIAIMSTLRSCSNFEDLVRELHSLGFTLSRVEDEEPPVLEQEAPVNDDVDPVKVEVELIEGNGVFNSTPGFLGVEDDSSSEGCNERRPSTPNDERYWERRYRWERALMRDQMEMAKSALDSATAVFLQGIGQVVQAIMSRPYHMPDDIPL